MPSRSSKIFTSIQDHPPEIFSITFNRDHTVYIYINNINYLLSILSLFLLLFIPLLKTLFVIVIPTVYTPVNHKHRSAFRANNVFKM
jgi:hypothetical protein